MGTSGDILSAVSVHHGHKATEAAVGQVPPGQRANATASNGNANHARDKKPALEAQL